jgi:hypothetical protein
VALLLLLALVRALCEAETEPVCETLALLLRVAEPLPRAVAQGSGDLLAVGDRLLTPEPASVPVLTGLPMGELLKIAVGAALTEARLETVALRVTVCVAHVLPLFVARELMLEEQEGEVLLVLEAHVRALREAETEPVPEALPLTVRDAEPLPLPVAHRSGDLLAVCDILPVPEPRLVPVAAGLLVGELLMVAVGPSLVVAQLEAEALRAAVCVAHMLPLLVVRVLTLVELEGEAQGVAEALGVEKKKGEALAMAEALSDESMELLRDGVLP